MCVCVCVGEGQAGVGAGRPPQQLRLHAVRAPPPPRLLASPPRAASRLATRPVAREVGAVERGGAAADAQALRRVRVRVGVDAQALWRRLRGLVPRPCGVSN